MKAETDLVVDLTGEQRKQEQRAARVLDFINSDVNDYLTDAVLLALAEASKREGIPLPEFINETRTEQIKLLAALLTATGGAYSLKAPPKPDAQAFAYHFAEALKIARESDDLPADLYNELGHTWLDFQNEMPSLARFSESEAFIALAIETAVRQAAEEGGAK